MKLDHLSLAAAMVLLGVAMSAVADTKTNPYEGIPERNPFRLKDPPPPPDPNATAPAPAAPLATVEVTGIFNMRTKKKVLLEIVPGPGKPAVKPILEEGERLDTIEVVSIDMDKNEVTINNAGSVTNIGLKVAAKAAGGPVPGGPTPIPPPGFGAAYVPPTTASATANPYGAANPTSRGSVVVAGGSPTAAPANVPGATPFGANPTTYSGSAGAYVPHAQPGAYNPGTTPTITGGDQFKNIPSRVNRAVPQTQTQGAQVDPAVQYINMAVQKQQAEARGKPFPPLPPVPGLDQ